MKINGIVLAAGFGKRLMPLTGHLPKPLLPVCGTPMLDIALEAAFEAGVEKVAVNAHHLAPLIESHLKASPFKDRVEIFHEAEILGTGGPLVNAKSLLSACDAFLLHNGDILSDFDLKALVDFHFASKALATMAALDGPENRLLVHDGKVLDILGRLKAGAPEGARTLTYAGIAVFSPEIFRRLPEKPVFCSIIDALLAAMAEEPRRVAAFAPEKPFWSDIGSFEQYFKVHESILSGKAGAKLLRGRKGPFLFGDSCEKSANAKLSGFVSASKGAVIEERASLCNCVLLDGARALAGERRRNEVLGDGFSVHRDQPALSALKILAPFGTAWRATSLVEQGSDRRFYRIKAEGRPSMALMLSGPADQDFQRFLDIGAFLRRNALRTPEIYASEPAEFSVLMEDLGDETLFDLVAGGASKESLYEKTVDALAEFQAKGTAALERESFKVRLFDRDYLRWESAYFMENFAKGLCRLALSVEESSAVDAELDALASSSFALPKTLMHRDFQSQNILLPQGAPRFVDFQGARLGPLAYDIASLLKDPYVGLSKALRDKLLKRHFDRLSESGAPFMKGMDFDRFREAYLACSLQRNMQALGAYGFLSLKKRKAKYLAFAEPCLALLQEGLQEAGKGEFNSLRRLCANAKEALSSGIEAAKAVLS